MASPFKFFRKHQASMMVVLVVLSMMLFTLDSLFSSREPMFWLLGLILGGAIFGTAGIGSGRWMQWGAGGPFLGCALGFIMPEFNRPPGVISTSLGIIEEEDLQDMASRRYIAHQFIGQAQTGS